MDSTIFNIVAFILITILYYVALKPKLTLDILSDAASYQKYNKSMHFRLAIYFLLVVLVQFGINASTIINKCGGNVGQNVGIAGLMTFLPWVLIFGLIMVILIIFPGFKSAFSDVIGYFYVSKQANDALAELLMDANIYNKIDNVQEEPQPQPYPQPQPQPQQTPVLEQQQIQAGGTPSKKTLRDAADAIVKLFGNMSVLINQIVPSNFLQYMEILKPLMKPEYESNPGLLKIKEQSLLDVVVTRDNIGEAFWYVYTGILLISIIQYNIVARPCVKDPATIKANYQKFLDEQEATNKEKARGQGVYTIKN
jgi:hypothetical protein